MNTHRAIGKTCAESSNCMKIGTPNVQGENSTKKSLSCRIPIHALTLPVVKTKAVLDTAFERPKTTKRVVKCLGSAAQLPCVMTSMSKNLAGDHPPMGPFQRMFTSSEAQTARHKENELRGAANHGSKTHGSTGAVHLSSVGRTCAAQVGGLHRGCRKLRRMAERWLRGKI